MKYKKLSILLCLCFLIPAMPAAADSPVWKVTKDGNTLFIGGTVHLLTQADYPLPDAFEAAYQTSSIIVFETDFQKLQAPETQQALLRQVAYPEGISLKDRLDQGTYADFLDYLKQRGLPEGNLVKFKAGMVSITLTMIELQRLGLTGTGVDQFFSLKALNDHKEIGKLETLDEQIAGDSWHPTGSRATHRTGNPMPHIATCKKRRCFVVELSHKISKETQLAHVKP